jgi:hypothetical protein
MFWSGPASLLSTVVQSATPHDERWTVRLVASANGDAIWVQMTS